MDITYSLIWFIIGIVSYRIISKLLQYGAMVNLYTQTLICSLAVLKMTDDNIITAQKLRRKNEVKAGKLQEEIEENDKIEAKSIMIWRELTIASIINLTPSILRPAIKFKNWHQAINFLDSKLKQH